MLDLLFVVASLAFFALAIAYIVGCDLLSPVASAFRRTSAGQK
jgi:hypothetical protein